MQIKPNEDDWNVAKRICTRFLARPGADHIASPYALAHLAAILRQADVNSVVEFGAGIGTVTYLLLTYPSPNRTVVSTESNEFCLEQLQYNIPPEFKSRLAVISDFRQPNGHFDLAIIDGKIPPAEDYPFLRPGIICFVEGNREPQRDFVKERCLEKGWVCDFQFYAPRHLPILKRKKIQFGYWPHFRWSGRRNLLSVKWKRIKRSLWLPIMKRKKIQFGYWPHFRWSGRRNLLSVKWKRINRSLWLPIIHAPRKRLFSPGSGCSVGVVRV